MTAQLNCSTKELYLSWTVRCFQLSIPIILNVIEITRVVEFNNIKTLILLWLEEVFIQMQLKVTHRIRILHAAECHPGLKHLRKLFSETKLPQSYLIGISRIMSRGKIIFMYGIGYMPNVHSTSSCIICRKVK